MDPSSNEPHEQRRAAIHSFPLHGTLTIQDQTMRRTSAIRWSRSELAPRNIARLTAATAIFRVHRRGRARFPAEADAVLLPLRRQAIPAAANAHRRGDTRMRRPESRPWQLFARRQASADAPVRIGDNRYRRARRL